MPVLKIKKDGIWEELGGTSPMNGGNADTLNGKSASEFALANHSHDEYAGAIHQHSYNDLLDKPTIPSSLPANGGNADTLDGQHATYFAKASDIANLQTKHIARTVTLYSYNWSSNSQTVTASGVTSSNTIIVSAHPSYQNDYNEKGVVCASQGTNTLTFTCKEVPTGNLQVNVIILN